MKYLLLSLILFATPAFADEWHVHYNDQEHPEFPQAHLNTFTNHLGNPCYADDCQLVYDPVERRVLVVVPVESEEYIRYPFQSSFHYH